MNVNIVLGFKEAVKSLRLYAYGEDEIDFFSSPKEGTRCTVSFAAAELEKYLGKLLEDAKIKISEEIDADAINIVLHPKSLEVKGENYSLSPFENGVIIEGEGRVGVLYGVYEFLKMQGFFWIEPGEVGEYCPKKTDALIIPEKKKTYKTTSPVGRGFSIDGRLNENEELFLWMARNRLNVYFNFPNTCRLGKKLGFILRDGGHIFENIMDPDRVTESGKTLFEEHEDWYGLPESGERKKETALKTQFCVSRPELLDYLSEELLRNIEGRWREAEEINVWGFDTWGGICTCRDCKALGNATDQNLYMASYFRDFLNKARAEGRLSRDVRMVLCSYEGSATIAPPENPVPQNLVKAGDHILFAPIVRCYEHGFGDRECSYNSVYDEHLEGWSRLKNSIPLSVLEYYNVSKFEDLPLLFLKTMKKDFVHYTKKRGSKGFSYMHIPMVNWGVRALTHILYAELSWNCDADVKEIISKYMTCRYGIYAERMSRVYKKVSDATESVSSWRAWKRKSLLSKLLSWNGEIPCEPLGVDDHFASCENFEIKGKKTVDLLKKALFEVERIIAEIKKNHTAKARINDAVNPEELLRAEVGEKTLTMLTDDRRGLIYGYESFLLSYLLGCYYNALYSKDNARADSLWREIEKTEDRLESYYLPATYTASLRAMISKDALSRTQLKETVMRCRRFRNSTNLNGAIK